MSKFTRLAITHALMMGGDAAMVVALADSFFFSVSLDSARTQVLLFLAIGFAPFLFVAPFIGPMIDRVPGGRRLVIQIIALVRIVLLLLMARSIDGLALFPLVFLSLVLQKTYAISKSALVPSTVRSERELVEANSKLGLVAGIVGAGLVLPAALLLQVAGSVGALAWGALLFAAGFVSALRLPKEVVAAEPADSDESEQLRSESLQTAALVMTVLRANVGFTFFHLAFWLRTEDHGTLLFGAAVGASALATMTGNAIAPRLRDRVREETMLSAALVVSAVAGVGLALLGGTIAAVALAAVVNFVAALGRLGFESIVQRDAPGANRGRAFAQFETRFQFAWAVAGFVAVALSAPGWVGFLVVGLASAAALVQLRVAGPELRRSGRRRNGRSGRRSSAGRGRRRRGPVSRRSGSGRNGAGRSTSGRPLPPPDESSRRRAGPGSTPPGRRVRSSRGRPERATDPERRPRSGSESRRDRETDG